MKLGRKNLRLNDLFESLEGVRDTSEKGASIRKNNLNGYNKRLIVPINTMLRSRREKVG